MSRFDNSREVVVEVKVKLTIQLDGDVGVQKVIDEMNYDFTAAFIDGAKITATEITGYKTIHSGN